jgi:hypothetical protein
VSIAASILPEAPGRRSSLRPAVTVALVAVVLSVLWLFAPSFFRINNLVNILVQASSLAFLATGMSGMPMNGRRIQAICIPKPSRISTVDNLPISICVGK